MPQGLLVNFTTQRFSFQRTASVAALLAMLSACAALEDDKVNYKSATKGPSLEVPPDLTQLRKESRYAIESTAVTATGFQNASSKITDSGVAANSAGDVRMERQGVQRWLVVKRPAEKLWDPLKEFWTSNGFALVTDTPDVGIMETDWAENRAKLPQDFIRQTLGRVLDSLYSTGERDKFRTRLERNAQGEVEIYITHRGMVEDYADSSKTRTIWKPRATDQELEIEFLRRMMIKLGASQDAAKTSIAPAASTTLPLTKVDGLPAIVVNDSIDRAWRKTGVALDRSGFTVEDRDRAQGVYFVRYVAPGTDGKEPGFFERMLSSKKDIPTLSRYRIALKAQSDASSWVQVQDSEGKPETSANAERILQLIANELR